MVGNRILGTLTRAVRSGDPPEMLDKKGLHLDPVEVTDRDDRHQVGPVPILVEAPERLVLEGLETLDRSYRAALCVPRAPQDHRELLVLNARTGATTHPPLFDDYTSFLINLLGIQCESVRPVFQDLERGGYHLGRVGWDLKHVPGLVEAGRGVQVRAHPHADRLHEIN